MRAAAPALLLLLASCGPEPSVQQQQPGSEPQLPEPSGPPVVQQVEPSAGGWRSEVVDGRVLLHLDHQKGTPLISMGCSGAPPKLRVSAPGIVPIGSEDRFMLGLDDEPITLVADLEDKRQPGVSAEAPVPEHFGQSLEQAREITILYGTQKIGPVAAPAVSLKQLLAKACGAG